MLIECGIRRIQCENMFLYVEQDIFGAFWKMLDHSSSRFNFVKKNERKLQIPKNNNRIKVKLEL